MTDDIVNRLRNIYTMGQLGVVHEAADEIERLLKQRNNLAWAIAWFLKGGSRDKLEQRFKDYEAEL